MNDTRRIVPSLWFDRDTEEAIGFYVAIFSGAPHMRGESRVISISRYEEGMEAPGAGEMRGRVITASRTRHGAFTTKRALTPHV